jgi:hypothetical protein
MFQRHLPSGHLRTGSSQSHDGSIKSRKAPAPRRVRTRLGSDHPTLLIISPAACPVKHFLPKFFRASGAGWGGYPNYSKSSDAASRVPLFFLP